MSSCSQIIKFALIFFPPLPHHHPWAIINIIIIIEILLSQLKTRCTQIKTYSWDNAQVQILNKLCQNKLCGQNQDYAFKKSYTFLWNTYLQVILVGNKCDMEDERVSSKKKNYDDNDDAKHVKIRYRFGYKSIIDDNDIDRWYHMSGANSLLTALVLTSLRRLPRRISMLGCVSFRSSSLKSSTLPRS